MKKTLAILLSTVIMATPVMAGSTVMVKPSITLQETKTEAQHKADKAKYEADVKANKVKPAIQLTDTAIKGVKLTQMGTAIAESTQSAYEYTEYVKKVINEKYGTDMIKTTFNTQKQVESGYATKKLTTLKGTVASPAFKGTTSILFTPTTTLDKVNNFGMTKAQLQIVSNVLGSRYEYTTYHGTSLDWHKRQNKLATEVFTRNFNPSNIEVMEVNIKSLDELPTNIHYLDETGLTTAVSNIKVDTFKRTNITEVFRDEIKTFNKVSIMYSPNYVTHWGNLFDSKASKVEGTTVRKVMQKQNITKVIFVFVPEKPMVYGEKSLDNQTILTSNVQPKFVVFNITK